MLARVAAAREDSSLLARADAWACRAAELTSRDAAAFVNPTGEISPETVGAVSPFHTRSGVAAAAAVIGYMEGDENAHRRALAEFLASAGDAVDNLDLTLGLSSTILGATQLWGTIPAGIGALRSELLSFGGDRVRRLWNRLDAEPAISRSALDNLGVAHGWGGFIYATLTWCAATAAPLPHGLEGRLDELARLAEPVGRGLMWPWMLAVGESSNYMPGWCNGSAGYVHLWTAAARAYPRERFTDLAVGAGWDAFDAADSSGTLCCGLAGRAYALLELHHHTGDGRWLDRARAVGYRSAVGAFEAEYAQSLYKGQLVLPLLAADLDSPSRASHPFFGATPV
jgi:serine/threonine-protein kinase